MAHIGENDMSSNTDDVTNTRNIDIAFEYTVRVESDDKVAISEAQQMFLQSTLFTTQRQSCNPYSWNSPISWFEGKWFFTFTFDARAINLFLALRDDMLLRDINKVLSISCAEFKQCCDIQLS